MSRTSHSGSWSGAWDIVYFNWPSYLVAGVVMGVCLECIRYPGLWRLAGVLIFGVTSYFTVASFLVSHWIYDRSALADWRWVPDGLPRPVGRWLLIQAGFDATYGRLQQRIGTPPVLTIDLYGIPGVGGASVERARRWNAMNPAAMASVPEIPDLCETVFAVFALHEIHTPDARTDFFRRMAKSLTTGGSLVVIEHLRNPANFLAFGFGFFHFLPEREWRRCGAMAALALERVTPITPFVRAFIWRRS